MNPFPLRFVFLLTKGTAHFARLTQVINKNNSGTNNHVDTPTLQPYNFTTNGHQLTKPVPIESPEKDLSIGTGLVSW